ncbi:hypothetical protein [Apilactobacillus micheneri]|uniref:hypothetical protein n=1 Tax=Apilactobacillus micheneri TaxID=1899430 RepID=UPI0011260461|nr:hypothetical protein [Apilactobacillus micheneri]TPR51072.1 hypothetical protein DY126_05900 [Apilactobacillus micheneri]
MQYNKQQFNKVNDKKIMKKVKKQWVVVSVASLAVLGGFAVSGTLNMNQPSSGVVAHASGEKVVTVEPKTGDADKTVEPKTGDADKTVEPKTGDADKTVEPKTGDADKTVEPKTGDADKTVEPKTTKNR